MKFEGEVGEIDLLPSLVDLWKAKFTGAWRFENDAVIKIVYLKEGDVLSASSNERIDTLDEILLKSGKVTRDHVKQALAKRKDNESLGDALLALGFIMKKELSWARRVQVVGILRSILHWGAGTYQIVADYLPKREEGTAFNLPQIVVELIVTETDRSKIEMPPDDGDPFTLARTPEFDQLYSRLDLNADADNVAHLIDGTRTSKEISEQAASTDAFSVFKLLYAFKILGLVEAKVKSQVSHEVSFDLDSGYFPTSPQDELSIEPSKTVAVPVPAPVAPAPRIERIPPPEVASSAAPTVALPYEPYEPLEKALDVATLEPRPALATTIPMSIPTPARAPRPARPVLSTPIAAKKKRGLLMPLVLLLIVGGAAGAYYWWSTHKAAPIPIAQKPKPVPAAKIPASETQTTSTAVTTSIAPNIATTSLPVTTTSAAPMTTTTASAKPAPVKPAPVQPAPVTTTAPPTQTTAAKPVTPVPAPIAKPPAPATPADARYAQMAADFKANLGSAHFTVQFELVCQGSSLDTAMKQGGSNIWFLPVDYKGRQCYRVFWGRYADRASAERALGSIPAALRGSGKPGVVSIDALR